MLSSKDAIADVVEEIKGVDFYRPGHELIFNTITDLYGRGDPADTVTTADELDRRGELERTCPSIRLRRRRCMSLCPRYPCWGWLQPHAPQVSPGAEDSTS